MRRNKKMNINKIGAGFMSVCNKMADAANEALGAFTAPVVAVVAVAGALLALPASAQTNGFPDVTQIYTSLSSPFNAALTWVIGAIAVLTVIGWVLKAVRRK